MKVLHLISGGDAGGARTHVLSLLGVLNGPEEIRLLCLGGGPLAEGAEALGLPHTVLPDGFAAAAAEAERIARNGGWQLLHCHGSRADLTGALLKRRLGIPVISTVHSDHRLDYLGRPMARMSYGALNAASLRRMDALVCVSEAMAELYRRRGFRRVYAVHNGTDFSVPRRTLARKDRAAALGLPVSEGDLLVGTAARLHPVKDLPTLLRGFALCGDKRMKLAIAGSGPEEGRLRALTKRLGLEDRVFLPGWVEDTETFFAALDIAALTSRSETFPYALTMAARYGLPAVSTAVGGVPELIQDGVTGLLIPPGDAAALGRALDRLAGDENLRRTLGTTLRQKAETSFSLAAMGARQREIYREIWKDRG